MVRPRRKDYHGDIERICDQEPAPAELIVVGEGVGQRAIPSNSLVAVKPIETSVGRFEAMRIGIYNSQYESVLFLDNDQVIEPGLLEELRTKQEDAVIIPERSLNRNLVGRLMDLKRSYLEELAKDHPHPEIPVIPRFYKKRILDRAFEQLPLETLQTVTQHEDSILYREAYDSCRKLSMSRKRIFNQDPDLFSFVRKAYIYGKANETALSSGRLTSSQAGFIRTLDRNRILYDRGVGFNPVLTIHLLQGIPYAAGSLSYKVEDLFRKA